MLEEAGWSPMLDSLSSSREQIAGIGWYKLDNGYGRHHSRIRSRENSAIWNKDRVQEVITTTNMLVRLASVTMLKVKEKERVAKNKQGVSLFYVATTHTKSLLLYKGKKAVDGCGWDVERRNAEEQSFV